MARPGFRHHQKLRRLAHLLGLPIPYAWGLCECLWDVAYANGVPLIGDSIDVELAAEWPNEGGKLTAALLSVRLIDEVESGKYEVHDLHENAPDFVRKRFERDQTRKHKYTPRRRNKGAEGGISPPNSDQLRLNGELGRTHSTAQHRPAQHSTDLPPKAPRRRGANGGQVIEPGFDDFWTNYPRKTAKGRAIKAWNKVAPNEELRTVIHAALDRQKGSPQWTKDGGQFVPHPATWLNDRRWEDEVRRETTGGDERLRRFADSDQQDFFVEVTP